LADHLAPVFNFVFETDKPGELKLDRLEVQCYEVSRHRGVGLTEKIAHYDVPLPTKVGIEQFAPPKPLYFTGKGQLQLRLWPSFHSQEGDTLDLEIRFRFRVGDSMYQAATGRFILKL
jgi:hypothetical protein